MQRLYFILIVSVFILSLLFGVLIWCQAIKFEKKALAAKRAKEEFLNQLKLEREEEERKIAEEQLEEQNPADNVNPDPEDNLGIDSDDKQKNGSFKNLT